jgi:hypothetical protein
MFILVLFGFIFSDDYGVFALKILDVWNPRAQLQNIFSSSDSFATRWLMWKQTVLVRGE